MPENCDRAQWGSLHKCPVCGGTVYAHFEDESNDNPILSIHCHDCGEMFDQSDIEDMDVQNG